jgi:lipopolysaccharide biosynthesis glycosyltransferase
VSELHLACSSDEAGVPHSAAMLHSVLANAGGHDVSIHFLHPPDLRPETRDRLAGMVEANGGTIDWLAVARERVGSLQPMAHAPATTWYGIFLPELLPDLDRILYLDIDTMAVDSLAPLWGTSLEGHHVGAVTNVFMREDMDRPARFGLSGEHAYFNAGVLLIDLELWRRDGCTEAIRESALADMARMGWAEQDAMNVVLEGRRLELHPRWNVMNSVIDFPWSADVLGAEAVEEARRNPGIRHFEGPGINKPWHYLCERAMRNLYLEHRSRTPWPEVELEGATPRNRARRLMRAARRRLSRSAARGGDMVSA